MQSSESMFRVPPFPAFPSANRYVNLGSLAEALVRVVRSVDAHEGLSMVVGPPGTGKSLLCNILVEHYQQSREVVVLGETPIDSEAGLLRRIMHHLGVKLSSIPDNDLQLALIDHVCGKDSAPNGLLILVDEAQSLPTQVLEAIRMTTNIMRRGEPRVSAVICGGPRLDDTLTSPLMEPFTQRIATRCYLHPLNTAETREYIREAIRRCGANPSDTITDEAISAVHHACSGVPRLINQLMTQAVDCAEAANHTSIGVQDINVAWAHLQQLPSPMLEEPKLAPQSSKTATNVEFGQLDESDYDAIEVEPAAEFKPQETLASELAFEEEQPSERTITCGTTCGCEPDTCARQTEAVQRIDEMSASLETIDDTVGELSDDAYEAAYDAKLSLDSRRGADDEPVRSEATIQWITEPGDVGGARHEPPLSVRQLEVREALPAALFGEFEEEESVATGASFATSQSQVEPQVSSDLESMLHEEIVGMSGDMQLFQFPLDNEDSYDVESCGAGSCSPTTCSKSPGAQRTESTTFPPSEPDLVLCGDDTDILIIEDDVTATHRVEPPRMRREEKTVNVDFQAMLTRMRGG